MSQPCQGVIQGVDFGPRQACRPIDHHDGQLQCTRRQQLRARALTARVFAHQARNRMSLQQRQLIGQDKRTARQHRVLMRQGDGFGQGFNQTQQVVMLGLRQKMWQLQPTQRQKNTLRRASQGRHSSRDIGYGLPTVARFRLPWGPREGQQGQLQLGAGGQSMLADLRRKGVGGINDVGDLSRLQVGHQAGNTTKATHAHRQGLRRQRLHPARIAENGGLSSQRPSQLGGFRTATKNKDLGHD